MYEPIMEKDAIVMPSEESGIFLSTLEVQREIALKASHSLDSISLLLYGGSCIFGD